LSVVAFRCRSREDRRMNRKTALFSALLVVVSFLLLKLTSAPALLGPVSAQAADKTTADSQHVHVEKSMHEFMEGLFQGSYRRLKPAMASEPTERQVWKAIRSDALILAESCNLLLYRKPDKDADKWVEFSLATRDAGAKFYLAAKQRDFPNSRKAYELMLTQCNACHKQFDDGKNQLEP
jgi:hypothetical protein